MNANQKDLTRTRITETPQVGWLIGFRNGETHPQTGRPLITRGFIRARNGNVYHVTSGAGRFMMGAEAMIYRYTE